MIGERENECISLSVLPVAWVMITQWEKECISVSVLSVAQVMIAKWENECISLSVFPVARVVAGCHPLGGLGLGWFPISFLRLLVGFRHHPPITPVSQFSYTKICIKKTTQALSLPI